MLISLVDCWIWLCTSITIPTVKTRPYVPCPPACSWLPRCSPPDQDSLTKNKSGPLKYPGEQPWRHALTHTQRYLCLTPPCMEPSVLHLGSWKTPWPLTQEEATHQCTLTPGASTRSEAEWQIWDPEASPRFALVESLCQWGRKCLVYSLHSTMQAATHTGRRIDCTVLAPRACRRPQTLPSL
jgi:hypothetical protein